jgi:ribosome biogenesis GTPase
MQALAPFGLTPEIEAAFASHAAPGALLGRVVRSWGRAVDVITESGVLELRAAGGAPEIAVGDWVVCDAASARVVAWLPRASAIVRKRPGRSSREQVICANVDVVFIVTGLDSDFSVRRIERYLAVAASGGANAVLVLTKADLAEDVDARVREASAVMAGRPVITVCAPRGEGVEAVRGHLAPGSTAVLLGSSGAGKSTLLNALLGEARAKIGDVMEDGRGKHTTTHRELFVLEGGGVIADVPGLREVGLAGGVEGVSDAFDDVEEIARTCRFGDCGHEAEPGCAVVDALADGRLDGARFEAYLSLRREAASQERRANEHERRRFEKSHPAVKLRQRRRRRDSD